jgi:hypothetical protein
VSGVLKKGESEDSTYSFGSSFHHRKTALTALVPELDSLPPFKGDPSREKLNLGEKNFFG